MEILEIDNGLTIGGQRYNNILAYDVSEDKDFAVLVSISKYSDILHIQHIASVDGVRHETATSMDIRYPSDSVVGGISVDLVRYESECEVIFEVNGREKYITFDTGSALHK